MLMFEASERGKKRHAIRVCTCNIDHIHGRVRRLGVGAITLALAFRRTIRHARALTRRNRRAIADGATGAHPERASDANR